MESIAWGAMYKVIKKDIKTNSDIIVALTHWYLIKRDFKCLGIGQEDTLRDNEASHGFDVLPDKWNEESKPYSLKYVFRDEVYTLMAFESDDKILLTLWNRKTNASGITPLPIAKTVNEMHDESKLQEVMKSFDDNFFSKSNEAPVRRRNLSRKIFGCNPLTVLVVGGVVISLSGAFWLITSTWR